VLANLYNRWEEKPAKEKKAGKAVSQAV